MFDEEDIEFIKNLEKTLTEDFDDLVKNFGVPDIPQIRTRWLQGLLIAAREDPVDDYILQKLCETMIEYRILEQKLKAATSFASVSLN